MVALARRTVGERSDVVDDLGPPPSARSAGSGVADGYGAGKSTLIDQYRTPDEHYAFP